jgi:hypothetical protein
MNWRYELFVFPLDVLWRVSILDEGARAPEHVRDFGSQTEAVEYAKGLAQTLASTGEHARIHLRDAGGERVIWSLPGGKSG